MSSKPIGSGIGASGSRRRPAASRRAISARASSREWEAFGTRMRQFADNVDRIASGIEKIARFLSWSSGSSTSLGTPGRTAEILNQMRAEREATPPDDRTLLQKILPKSMGGKDAPAAGDGSRSFRNNNPGNIKMGPLARSMGATEADDKGFARFSG